MTNTDHHNSSKILQGKRTIISSVNNISFNKSGQKALKNAYSSEEQEIMPQPIPFP